jgi:hypothetical protein
MTVERISIPEVLSRPCDHAVICTFGANLDFYEGPLWRHISRARNRVVLADDVVLAGQLADLASGGSRLRHINRHYLATPITNERSAHAKLILLVDASGGTLLVGSGNVGMDGYASRGEVFCRYDITDDDATYLPEFQAAKDFLDLMVGRGYLDVQARHHLDAVWADTPWVWAPPTRASGVRHNLVVPLGDQLVEAVGSEHVVELTVHAPFHDERCEALRRLVAALQPEHVTMLVQPGRTSVDPGALSRVLDGSAGSSEVQLAAAPEFPETSLHAKFVLVRTATRSITFTGSANLSLAALWRTDQRVGDRPAGNIELVNLAEGPLERFDELLAGLALVEPTEPVAQLDVRYLGDSEANVDARLRLTRGAWTDGTLTLVAAAELPAGKLTLIVAGSDTSAEITSSATTITVVPAPEVATVLDSRVVPVWLRIAAADGDVDTTPVYPYHPGALATLLAARRDPDLLRKAGSLDMEAHDDVLTALLDELDAALVIDRHSLWRLARRTAPADTAGVDSDGPRRAWEDLDFDALRRHPRLAQYQSLGRPTERLEATDLQIVLGAITDHFRGFGTHDIPPAPVGPPAPEGGGDFDVDLDDETATLPSDRDDTPVDETPEEFEADEADEERERRRLKTETRNRLAWQRFAERFTKALRDQDFLDVVGPRVAIANAVILNHLLALLVAKGVVAADKGIGYQVDLWSFLWGEGVSGGYLDSLPDEEQMAAIEEFSERGLEVTVLSAVDLAAQLTRRTELDGLRSRLRYVWRRMLTSSHLFFTGDVLSRVSRPGVRPATELADALDHLARESSRREVDDAVADCLGTTRSQLTVRQESVHRGPDRSAVEVIEIGDPAVDLTTDVALAVFAQVVAVDRRRDYIRLKHRDSRITAAWDRRRHDCWWYDPNTEELVDLTEPAASDPGWVAASESLMAAAQNVETAAA